MTTDLGFAHFEAPGLGPVGVVDVPGHERFIRNMVAGASSVDGALLVVAADDGWMEETGRHLAVLKALARPVVAVAVTKADLAGEERAREVGSDAAQRVAAALGTGAPDFVAVDALHGRGVEELRSRLVAALAGLGCADRPAGAAAAGVAGGAASLDIDRVFTLRGVGLVVAGRLRGGELARGGLLRLLPEGSEFRVRGLQCYGREVETASPGCRVALALSHAKTAPRRGDRLVEACPVSGSRADGPEPASVAMRSFYATVEGGAAGFRPRPGYELEFAIGTAHRAARAWPSRSGRFLRIQPVEAVAARPGERLLFLPTGGADLLAYGRVVAAGGETRVERSRFEAALARAETEAGRGYGALPRLFRLALDGFLVLAEGEAPPEGAPSAGSFALSPPVWEGAVGAILSGAEAAGGLPAASLSSLLHLPEAAIGAILARLEAEGRIARRGASIRPPGPRGEATSLPPAAERLLRQIEAAGRQGYEKPEAGAPGSGKDLALLCRAGLVLGLDSRLFLSRAAYDGLVGALLEGRAAGGLLALAEAKEATGFSRKWILPFLARVERDGWLRREGETRLILRSYEGSGL
jgi:selenocysteine-specific elongation factor